MNPASLFTFILPVHLLVFLHLFWLNKVEYARTYLLYCGDQAQPRATTKKKPSENTDACSKRSPMYRINLAYLRLVSCLLHGTWFLIVKCTACFSFFIKSFQTFRIIKLAQRIFIIFIHLRNLSKILIFLAFPGNFDVKNDNNYSHHVLATKFEFAGFARKQKYMAWTVSKEMLCTSKSHPTKK